MASHRPSKPAFYARISLDRTGEQIGVKDQIDEGRRHFADMNWPDPIIYTDNDRSAAGSKLRPGFEQMLRDVESGEIDAIGARHLDRLLRRVLDLERILDVVEKRKPPVLVTFVHAGDIDLETASGRMLARILASVAANESELKGERVRAARRREASAGRPHGPLGYGYNPDNSINWDQAQIVKELAARILAGESLRSLATELNNRGVTTPAAGRWDARKVASAVRRGERPDIVAVIDSARALKSANAAAFARLLRAAGAPPIWTAEKVREQTWFNGLDHTDHGLDDSSVAKLLTDAGVAADPTAWRAANVRAMMRRGALCGWREFSPGARGGSGELVAQGSWTPILTKETTERIREITNREGVRQKGRPPKHLLASILRCAQCGSSMGGSPDGHGGTRYACSKQPGRDRCGGVTVTGRPVEELVTRTVLDALADAGVRVGRSHQSPVPAKVAAAQKELLEVQALRESYPAKAAYGEISLDQWAAFSAALDERERAASRIIGTWAPSTRRVLRAVPVGRADIESWWAGQDTTTRRDVIKVLIDHIPVHPANGARRFDPSRLGVPIWRV